MRETKAMRDIDAADLELLGRAVEGRLVRVEPALGACQLDPESRACAAALTRHANPFALEEDPGASQTTGWFGAFETRAGTVAVAARSVDDLAAAVTFARRRGVGVVVKGCGHDYLARSSNPDALLVWTHAMRQVHLAQAPDRFPASTHDGPVLRVEAGARWSEAYGALAGTDRFVVGGGCLSVGAAGGFVQGGGYSSWSRRFGTAAGNVLEIEVVTADGDLVVANAEHHADLFWALRGGGGGTFGVVSAVTYRTHRRPDAIGGVTGTITASSPDRYRELVAAVVEVMPSLASPCWGEQIRFGPDNRLELSLATVELGDDEARRPWRSLLGWVEGHPGDFEADVFVGAGSIERFWDARWWHEVAPHMICTDRRGGQPPGQFWWRTNQDEVSQYVNAYRSRYLPARLVTDSPAVAAEALFEASRHTSFGIHLNKGLAGAAPEAVARDRTTSINPAVFDALGLVIMASLQPQAYPGVRGHEPDVTLARAGAAAVSRGMDQFASLTPGAGTYVNESDYFEADWAESYWGSNYARLLEIKRRYDPDNVFGVHHGVGDGHNGVGDGHHGVGDER